MNNSEEFKKSYAEIKEFSSAASKIFAAANNYVSQGVKILAKEFDYAFVTNKALQERLQEACERMLLARTGLLHPNDDVAFEDLARNIHLQLEGLANCWFNQWLIRHKSLLDFPLLYTQIKTEQQLTLSFFNGRPINKLDAFKNELAVTGQFLIDFCNDYLKLDFAKMEANYGPVFQAIGLSYKEFIKPIRKISTNDRTTAEQIDFSVKSEFIYLIENGLDDLFTNHPISRLTQYRNALLAHMGTGRDKNQKYYKDLVDNSSRQRIIVEVFIAFYETVKKRVS